MLNWMVFKVNLTITRECTGFYLLDGPRQLYRKFQLMMEKLNSTLSRALEREQRRRRRK
jgi:hypothetical protein